MSSPTPIITPPTRPRSVEEPIPMDTTVKPQGLHNWRTVIKQYSTWALTVLLAAPDLYQAAATLGMLSDEAMPEALKWTVRSVAGVGLILKFIKQQKPAA